jgi:hypothetical protein
LVFGILLVWAIFNARRSHATVLGQHNAGSPDYFIVDEKGVHSENSNGATTSQPWPVFKYWSQGSSVSLIFLAQGKFVQILPTGDLSPVQQEALKGSLTSFLGCSTKPQL